MLVASADQTLIYSLGWRRDLTRDIILVLLFGLLIALSARLVIPLPGSPVPLTGQSFAVLLSGALLGSRRGLAAVMSYLGGGVLGLPVFFGGASGAAHLVGPTGGYLLGFAVAALLVGCLAERGFDRRFASSLVMMILGQASIYLFGLLWLSRFVPFGHLLRLGLYPFLLGDALKLALAAVALPSAWSYWRRRH